MGTAVGMAAPIHSKEDGDLYSGWYTLEGTACRRDTGDGDAVYSGMPST